MGLSASSIRTSARRRGVLAAVVAIGLAAAACGPPPPPPPAGPTWDATQIPRTVAPSSITNHLGAWTDDDWFATLRVSSPIGSGTGPSAELLVFPRTGPDGAGLGTPQEITPSIDPSLVGPVGESVIGLGGSGAFEFFREDAGTWSSIGTFALAEGQQYLALTDDWLVLRTISFDSGAVTAVQAHPLDVSGPSVVVGPPQSVLPDPSWSSALQEGFGARAALDGGVLAVAARGASAPAPPGVRVFRDVGGVWVPQLSLGGVTGGPEQFGEGLAVDDGAAVDRIALGVRDAFGQPSRVEVFADDGGGFVADSVVERDASESDTFDGALFGASIALEGPLLAVSGRGVEVPTADPAADPVTVADVQLFRSTSTVPGDAWQREAAIPTSVVPAPTGVISAVPFALQAAANHVAVNVFVQPEPPPGCVFPCFVLGFEAWSLTRSG